MFSMEDGMVAIVMVLNQPSGWGVKLFSHTGFGHKAEYDMASAGCLLLSLQHYCVLQASLPER